uniref:Uncharacterized protein n=1 Tax=viral metagenome TaxID=1070528 RepID=A0A6H1ZUF2_9ZZZZ
MTPLEKLWTIGYGLDLGGYEFDSLGIPSLAALQHAGLEDAGPILCWDDPKRDDFPFGYPRSLPSYKLVLLILPTDWFDLKWPDSFQCSDYRYVLRSCGTVNESDRDCICHGKLVEWTGAAGEPRKPECNDWLMAEAVEQGIALEVDSWIPDLMWGRTGNVGDRPYPSCDRCGGDGSVTSPGGAYAWYEVEDK